MELGSRKKRSALAGEGHAGAAGDVRLKPHADRCIKLMGTHAPDVHRRIVGSGQGVKRGLPGLEPGIAGLGSGSERSSSAWGPAGELGRVDDAVGDPPIPETTLARHDRIPAGAGNREDK